MAKHKYIRQDAAIDAVDVCNLHRGIIDALQAIISDIPSADVVEVVRCKECKYWCSTLTYIDLLEARHDPYTDGVCDLYDCDGFQPNDFCSKAVRRDNYGADMREVSEDG